MSKLKIKLKLTGFELEIEGTREDVPNIQQAIGRQLGGLLQPAGGMLGYADDTEDASEESNPIPPVSAAQTPLTSPPKKRKKRSSGSVKASVAAAEDVPVAWPRDAFKFGTPNQGWSTAEKALWTLYVAYEAAGEKDLTAKRLCDTFNTHYRQAKPIKVGNVNRDLGNAKTRNPSLVGEDTTQSPPAWFLTEEGIKEVQKRIASSQSGNSQS